jgi:predicted alpha/beta superfamily hydrolase
MQEIKRFQIRGVPGEVVRSRFGARIVDYWMPHGGSEHLLIAHDGQNVFDGKTSTHRGQTWKLAQAAIDVAQESGITPPAIIAVWHSSSKEDPWGRAKDLAPEKFFTQDTFVDPRWAINDPTVVLNSDSYLEQIFKEIVPAIYGSHSPEKTAVIGSSMGGLATLYAAIQHPEKFTTALALSPHWTISNKEFVQKFVGEIPKSTRVWLSIGTKGLDAEYREFHETARNLLIERGFQESLRAKIFEKSGHNERSWARDVREPLRYWLKVSSGQSAQSGVR